LSDGTASKFKDNKQQDAMLRTQFSYF